VAGRIDDVDARALPLDARALGEDGDAPLFFEIVGIHGPLFHALIVAECAGLAEQLVNEGRLAVIDVGDDRHVAQAAFGAGAHGVLSRFMGCASLAMAGPLQQSLRRSNHALHHAWRRTARNCGTTPPGLAREDNLTGDDMADLYLKALESERKSLWAACRLKGLPVGTPERQRIAELDELLRAHREKKGV